MCVKVIRRRIAISEKHSMYIFNMFCLHAHLVKKLEKYIYFEVVHKINYVLYDQNIHVLFEGHTDFLNFNTIHRKFQHNTHP